MPAPTVPDEDLQKRHCLFGMGCNLEDRALAALQNLQPRGAIGGVILAIRDPSGLFGAGSTSRKKVSHLR